MTEKELKDAHKHCIANEDEVLVSDFCGCFYCCRIFKPNSIKYFTNEKHELMRTAHCPYCDMDTVVGTYSKYTINSTFLHEMNEYWFKKDIVCAKED